MTDPLVSREKHQLSTVIMVGVVALLIGGLAGFAFGRTTVSDGYHRANGTVADVSDDGDTICLSVEDVRAPQCFANGLAQPVPVVGTEVEILFALVPLNLDKSDYETRMVVWAPA